MSVPHHRVALAALILAAGLGGAQAVEVRRLPPAYAPAYGYGGSYGYGEYGFADEAVRGRYIGAPLTQFPRPSALVPPAWSYGTYGIPTVSGIAPAPVGQPTLTRINAQEPERRPMRNAVRGGSGPRILARGSDGGWADQDGGGQSAGIRVIEVRVPRR